MNENTAVWNVELCRTLTHRVVQTCEWPLCLCSSRFIIHDSHRAPGCAEDLAWESRLQVSRRCSSCCWLWRHCHVIIGSASLMHDAADALFIQDHLLPYVLVVLRVFPAPIHYSDRTKSRPRSEPKINLNFQCSIAAISTSRCIFMFLMKISCDSFALEQNKSAFGVLNRVVLCLL